MDFCTSCGRPRTGADRFCTTCGTEFRDLVPPGQPAAAADPASAEDYYAPGSVGPGPPISQWAPYARPPETEPSYPGEVYSGIAHDERFGGEPVYRGEPAFGGPGYTGGDSYPEPARRPPGRRNVPIVIAAAVIVLGAAGGAYAVTASHSHGKAAGEPTETASIAASQGAPTSAVQTSAAPATSAPAPPTASSGTTVSVASGAANNPAATQVTALVNSYFTAINARDYSAFASLLDQQARQQNPESTFDSGYATTADSAETLTSISDTGSGGLAASLTFTSQQSPADSPDDSSCDQWSITLFLVPNGTGYLIGTPPSSYQGGAYQAC
jgi:hypothetical protein